MFQKIFKHIIIIRPGALGDFVISLPVITGLRQTYPESRITVAARNGYARLAEGYADQLLDLDILTPGHINSFANKSDLLLCWAADRAGYVPAEYNGELVLLSPSPPDNRNASRYYFDAVPLIQTLWQPPQILITHNEVTEARRALSTCGIQPDQSFYAIHPGSGGRKKCWPAAKYAQLIEHLKQAGRHVLLMAGEADRETMAKLLRTLPEKAVPVLTNLDIRQLAAVLSLAHIYVGNDSGVSHVAAAAGARSVILFGPTDPAVWAPPAHAHVVAAQISCRPCGTTRPSCEHLSCLERLDVTDVLEALHGIEGGCER